MLTAQAQIVLFWGREFVALYNDAYAPTIGDKHPKALGRPAPLNLPGVLRHGCVPQLRNATSTNLSNCPRFHHPKMVLASSLAARRAAWRCWGRCAAFHHATEVGLLYVGRVRLRNRLKAIARPLPSFADEPSGRTLPFI